LCIHTVLNIFFLFDYLVFLDSAFDHASHKFLLSCINNNGTKSNINKLRQELKTLTREVNSKRKEINLTLLNEDGLKKNIKHLEDIISIKVINNNVKMIYKYYKLYIFQITI